MALAGERPWEFKSPEAEESGVLLEELQKATGLSRVTLQVCILRGLTTPQAIQQFLSPKFENLSSPFTIRDMRLGVDRLLLAKTLGEKVRIFGDYDVDGTTGAALLSWVFRDLGLSYEARQPDRFKDGYGLNPSAVKEAVDAGAKVLVTVDCGITSFAAADLAKQLGMDLVVIDHHQIDPVKGLPPALAVINPQRADCESGLKQLCGCGLAFYFSMALRSRAREEGWFAGRAEPNLKQHLDLVVMATAADMVPLTGDNHILVRYGLEVLKKSTKPGVSALLQVAGLGARDISPSHLGFVLGPRINASGRMHSASLALEMLTTTDTGRAFELAATLEKLNKERAEIQNQIWDQIRVRVEQGLARSEYQHAIAIGDEAWHEGVIGIVASRVTETFRKPAAVIAIRDGLGKGSVRSFAGKDVLAALRECSGYLKGFGGHRHAAGFSLDPSQIQGFCKAFDAALEKIPTESRGGTLMLEGQVQIEDLSLKNLLELESLGPFGPGNPEPVFSVRAVALGHQILKGRHLRLELSQEGSKPSRGNRPLKAIWFNAAEKPEVMDSIALKGEHEWAGVPEINRFQGQSTPSLRVRDWREVEAQP